MIIEQPAKWLRWLYPRATWRMDKNEKAVYLTFDDGPIPESTPFILKTLAEYGAHATFFMVGENVSKHPELFRQIVEAGHQVGNHTYNHWGGFKHSTKAYSANTEKANRRQSRRLSPYGSVQTAARVDAVGTVFLAGAQIPHRDVGPRYTRLQQMAYCRRRAEKR